jgi:drug/metabolite transporter (DMT)-like permease
MTNQNPNSSFNRGFLAALSSAFFLSFTGILIRLLIVNYQMPALVIAYWREAFVALILAAILIIFHPHLLKSMQGHTIFLIAFGFSLALMNALWIVSVSINGAAVSTALVYISGAFSALLGWLFLHERLTGIKMLAVVISFCGCVLVVQAYDAVAWQLNLLGIFTGVTAGLIYAVYSLLGRRASQLGINPWASLLAAFGTASCFMLLFNLGFGKYLPGGAQTLQEMFWLGDAWHGWGILLLLAAGPTLLGFGLYNISLHHLPASVANLIATIEPVFTATVAFFILGEVLTLIQILGGVLILIGVILLRVKSEEAQE